MHLKFCGLIKIKVSIIIKYKIFCIILYEQWNPQKFPAIYSIDALIFVTSLVY